MKGSQTGLTNNTQLKEMIDDMAGAPTLYRPNKFWQICSDRLIADLEKGGIENFRALPTSLNFFVPTYAYPGYWVDGNRYTPVKELVASITEPNKLFVMRLENLLMGKIHALSDYRTLMASSSERPPYTDMISESNIGCPVEQFEFDGRTFSRSFLNYLIGINFLKRHLNGEKIETVMEIGGGYGTLGEILLKDQRNNCFYLDVDIPPLAYISEWYLKTVFGRKAVAGYATLKKKRNLIISELREIYRAAVLCSWQLPELKGKIDLFVNFISFQEMEPDIVENYCRYVLGLSPEFILLRNLREGKRKISKEHPIGVETPILGGDYNRYLPGYQLIDSDTTVFGFETEDGFHSELRLYRRS